MGANDVFYTKPYAKTTSTRGNLLVSLGGGERGFNVRAVHYQEMISVCQRCTILYWSARALFYLIRRVYDDVNGRYNSLDARKGRSAMATFILNNTF